MTSSIRCAVIGGGPAGLFAAYTAASTARELGISCTITVYERNREVAKKLLLTGAGQCNITRNASISHMLEHYGDHGRFLRPAMYALSPEQTIDLFTSLGLPLFVREDDKVFPLSLRASDVRDTLIKACESQQVIMRNNTRIQQISRHEDGFTLSIGHHKTISAESVIICTGGLSFPKTGSTGDGHQILASLGHTITDLRPGLCKVRLPNSTIGRCSGITLEQVSLSFMDISGKRRQSHGSLLFTHTGLSGPVILHAVRFMPEQCELSLCLLPRETGKPAQAQEVEARLRAMCNEQGSAQLTTVLHRLGLPMKLIQWLLDEHAVDGTCRAAQVSSRTCRTLAQALVALKLTASSARAQEHAMVTVGGASLAQFDPKTMESRLIPRLFCAGEIFDIDGDTGGYNLQAAWSTGYLAGKHAVQCFT